MMKRVLVVLILGFMAGVVQAQNATKVQEPEYINVFFALSPTDGALVPLERQTGAVKGKLRGLGFGGMTASVEVKSEKSSIRFKADLQPSFVVRLASPQTDPSGAVRFFSWQPKKGVRSLVIGEGGGFTAVKVGSGESYIEFDAARYGESSVRISPTKPLAPGEYGFGAALALDAAGLSSNYNSFSFGIDPPEDKTASKQK
jgi:hypothetical protein